MILLFAFEDIFEVNTSQYVDLCVVDKFQG